jgi:MFS family permease
LTCIYSLTTIYYPDDKEKMIGYVEASLGLGCSVGPIFGSILYEIGGFQLPFYFFGLIYIIMVPFVYKCLPNVIVKE